MCARVAARTVQREQLEFEFRFLRVGLVSALRTEVIPNASLRHELPALPM